MPNSANRCKFSGGAFKHKMRACTRAGNIHYMLPRRVHNCAVCFNLQCLTVGIHINLRRPLHVDHCNIVNIVNCPLSLATKWWGQVATWVVGLCHVADERRQRLPFVLLGHQTVNYESHVGEVDACSNPKGKHWQRVDGHERQGGLEVGVSLSAYH